VIGFGLDFAGYTANKTSIAAIEPKGDTAEVTLLRRSRFHGRRPTSSPIPADEEAEELLKCIKVGPIAVDIPIDLQGLPYPKAPREIWELTLRPIDRELGAMPPLADRIGAPVARFAAIMKNKKVAASLGQLLFETYPAATWPKIGIIPGAYKSTANEKEELRYDACMSICEKLCMDPRIDNDDDIDAVVCAITAVAPRSYLCAEEDYKVRNLPRGFRLLKVNPFKRIRLGEENFSEWFEKRKVQ
jgi:hypothetical protein